MAFYLNLTNCGDVSELGTLGCTTQMFEPNNFWLLESGTSIDPNAANDQELIDSLIQAGKLIVLTAHRGLEDSSAETVYEETPGGKIFVKDGLMEFVATFSNGHCYSNNLGSLSRKKWDLLIVDSDEEANERLWGTHDNEGNFKGFKSVLVQAENVKMNDGTAASKRPLRIQLGKKGTKDFNNNRNFITSDVIEFSEVEGVNGITLEANNTLASSFSVSANLSCGGGYSINSLNDANNWQFVDTSDNSVHTPTGVTLAGDSYNVTGISAGTYKVQLYDNSGGFNIVKGGDHYFKSNTLMVTLT